MIHSRARTLATQRMLGAGGERGDLEFHAPARHPKRAGAAPPAVFGLHGFTGTASELRPLLERIAAEGYAVDVPLMPGHGDRADALQGLSFDDWVRVAKERVLEARARHGRVVVLGFSLGSLVAMQIAIDLGDAVDALIVLGNALELTAFSSVPFAIVDRMKVSLPDWYLVKFRAADMRNRQAARAITTYDRHPLRAALEVYRAGKRLRGEVSRIACPTFIGHGAHDLVCRPRAATFLRDHLATPREKVAFHIYPNSGHVVACDYDREALATDTLKFLSSL